MKKERLDCPYDFTSRCTMGRCDCKPKEEMKNKKQGYSEEDMGIIEISSIEANYIPHYQTKEGQFLATKFNVKQFKNK